MVVVVKEEIRKGPWTEQEDMQLVCYVSLFGERRWDFLAKVSGLNRTGKSCRLRWVNYLHPGLKRGRMTPQEERLILELHSRWGNRWSRIARKLPGRTDNEIKNYWRTHMRKKAQERRRNSSPSSSSSSSSSSTTSASSSSSSSSSSCANCNSPPCNGPPSVEAQVEKFIGCSFPKLEDLGVHEPKAYSMDQIWMEMGSSETVSGFSFEDCKDEACVDDDNIITYYPMPSPTWEYYSDTLWKIDDEELRMFPPMGGPPSL